MRHGLATRLVVAATLALGECSPVNADSFKVVTPPTTEKQSPEVARPASSSSDQFDPYATVPGPDIQVAPESSHSEKTIVLLPGHMTKLNLDWDIGSVHVGDPDLINVTPVLTDNRSLMVGANSIVNDEKDKDKRFGRPVSRANFYVLGTDRKNVAVYEVEIHNYLPNTQPANTQPANTQPANTNTVEIHNQKELANSTNYKCEYSTGCKLSGGGGGGGGGDSGGETPKQ
jgi:hypothetical protein